MNRRVTGWLAWSALALIIGVPSVEIALSDADEAATANVVGTQPETGAGFFGPMPAPNKSATDPFALPEQTPVEEQIAVAESESPEEETQAAVADVAENDEVAQPDAELKDEPVKDEPVVADAVHSPRVVGAPRVVRPSGRSGSNSEVAAAPDVKSDAEPEATEVATGSVLEPIESRTGNADALKTALASPQEEAVPAGQAEQVAAVAEEPAAVAPEPMPASMRPPAPTRVASTASSFEEDVRRSIENLRTSRAPMETLPRDDGYEVLGDVPYEEDPYYREPEMLEPFEPGEFAAEDYAGDSEFYEIWQDRRRSAGFRSRGSFSEQLPARRGTGVRLDLLQ